MCQSKPWLFSGLRQLDSIKPATPYGHWLKVATRSLFDSFFGQWVGLNDDGTPNPAKDKIDHRYWESTWGGEDWYPHGLKVKNGKSPAEAIAQIIEHPTLWTFDCDHIVMVSNLYAMVMTLGAVKFEQLVPPEGMLLRKRESLPMKTIEHYVRDEWQAASNPVRDQQLWRAAVRFTGMPTWDVTTSPHPPFEFQVTGGDLSVTTAQLLRRAPPGSRVRWTNLYAPHEHEFRHENAVKLQDNIYVAGGIDPWLFTTLNEFSREELEYRMSSVKTLEGIKESIIIDEIEIFEMHG